MGVCELEFGKKMFKSFAKNFSTLKSSDYRRYLCHNLKNKNLSLLQQLSLEFEDVSYILPSINTNIKNIPLQGWKERIVLLKKFNFRDGDCFKMINRYPEILTISVGKIEHTILQWKLCKMEWVVVSDILLRQPILLNVDINSIAKRIPFFSVYCKNNKTLANFLVDCPNTMLDDWKSIECKMKFLLTEKWVAKGEIFQSNALAKPLDFINLRFTILEKCGIYRKIIKYPHKENRYEKLKVKNPTLNRIVDTDNNIFSKTVANITLEEYEIFEEFYHLESNKKLISSTEFNEDESESDNDDDDDDDVDFKKNYHLK